MSGGRQFEAEIREQPAVLRRLARSTAAAELAAAIGERDALFLGSGSSWYVAQLAALAWQRRAGHATPLAASEARFQAVAQHGRCAIAFSQSGRTADVLEALDALAPSRIVALTNDAASPLAARAGTVIDVGAGTERAVPASKSVTAMAATVLWAAARATETDAAIARALEHAADALEAWLAVHGPAEGTAIAERFEAAQSLVIAGAGYGVPVAAEIALKIKEAAYRHAEGFAAGEFRHGSTAILDEHRGLIGILDDAARANVLAVLEVARAARSVTLTIGDAVSETPSYGPRVEGLFAPIGWIVAGQLFALALARHAGIDSDAPRGLQKFLGR